MKLETEPLFDGDILTLSKLDKEVWHAAVNGKEVIAAGITGPGDCTCSGSPLVVGDDREKLAPAVAEKAGITVVEAEKKISDCLDSVNYEVQEAVVAARIKK